MGNWVDCSSSSQNMSILSAYCVFGLEDGSRERYEDELMLDVEDRVEDREEKDRLRLTAIENSF